MGVLSFSTLTVVDEQSRLQSISTECPTGPDAARGEIPDSDRLVRLGNEAKRTPVGRIHSHIPSRTSQMGSRTSRGFLPLLVSSAPPELLPFEPELR